MNINSLAYKLRIFISSTDKLYDATLYELKLHEAMSFGLAGTTVIKGIFSYGASSVIHQSKFWETKPQR